jgi:hypothetical protein
MKRTAVRLATLLPLALGACGVTKVMHPTVSGSIVVTDADGARAQWSPDRCVSGDLAYFAGFDFLSTHDGGHLRAALHPIDGPAVRWNFSGAPANTVLTVRRDDCSLLDVDVQPTAWRVNDVREFTGHLALRCTFSDGRKIEGRIDVDHCH